MKPPMNILLRGEDSIGVRPKHAESTSGDHFAEVSPGDPLYRDLQLRGYNRRFVGAPDSVIIVDDTDQAVAVPVLAWEGT